MGAVSLVLRWLWIVGAAIQALSVDMASTISPVFGNAEAPNWTAWAVLGAMVTTLGAFGTAVLSYMAQRDKLKYDSELAKLRGDVEESRVEHEECQRVQVILQQRASEAERKSAENAGLIRGMEIELTSLRAEVHDLRDRLHGTIK